MKRRTITITLSTTDRACYRRIGVVLLALVLIASAIAAPIFTTEASAREQPREQVEAQGQSQLQPQFEPINGTGAGENETDGTNTTNAGEDSIGRNPIDTNGTNGTNGTNNSSNGTAGRGSSGGGFGFGIPSTEDLAGDMVNATMNATVGAFTDAMGFTLLLPWEFITIRFAPFESAGNFGSNAWSRPPGLWGEIYDIAVGSIFGIAVLLFVLMYIIDLFGNFSPRAEMGAVDRILLRSADTLHLLFSWPVAWAHFLIASVIAAAFLPGREDIVSTVGDSLGNIAGVAGAGAAFIVLPFLLLIVAWLLAKHAGAFIYLIIGLATYPALVAMSIPDHWLIGKLGAYAENARAKYPKAAWYPVPTAIVLGIGYTLDDGIIDLLASGDLLQQAGAGVIFYPLLWLSALYAPEKVFSEGGITDQVKNASIAGIAGGAAGAATGSAAGASSGAASGAASGGASGALPAGGSAVAGALPEGRGGSAGAKALSDGGASTVNWRTAEPTQQSNSSYTNPYTNTDANTYTSLNTNQTGSIPTDSSPDRTQVDLNQRYEPVVHEPNSGFNRVESPRNAEWLVDRGGVERLDNGTDDPLRFRGENDGRIYDLRSAAGDSGVFESQSGGSESIRGTR